MHSQLSFIDLFLQAGLLVQGVMLLLLLMSLTSWMIIFQRKSVIDRAQKQRVSFERKFWSGVDLASLFKEITAKSTLTPGIETLFHAGFKEFARLRTYVDSKQEVIHAAQRAMRVAHSREIDRLEQNTSVLATIGSISPYIGLFGTVWGIMNAFISLGDAQQATLQAVAPGIAEALIATAIGLFAAIPAVIAYNRFSYRIERLENQYINFAEEFIAILQRQTLTDKNQQQDTGN